MVEVETRQRGSHSEIGSKLADIAEQLQSDGPVTIEAGGRSMELDPAEPMTLELEGETEQEAGATAGSIELKLEWRETAGGGAGGSGSGDGSQE